MKIRLIVLLTMVALASSSTFAQSGEGSKPKKDTTDYLEQSMQKMAAELSLDSFQQAVITDSYKSSQAEQQKILAMPIPDESKTEKLLALRDKLNAKILGVLTPEQAEKYEKLKEKNNKKKKTKAKDKKNEVKK